MSLHVEELCRFIQGENSIGNVYVYPLAHLELIAVAFSVNCSNPIAVRDKGFDAVILNGQMFCGRLNLELEYLITQSHSELIQASLALPQTEEIVIPPSLKAKPCDGLQTVQELFDALYTDFPRYKIAANYLLFNHCAICESDIIETLKFCRYAAPEHVRSYLMSNMPVSLLLFDDMNVFALNKAWLQFDGCLSKNFVDGFAEVHFTQIERRLKKLFAEYEEMLVIIQGKSSFEQFVVDSDYSPVTSSHKFLQIMNFVHRYFYNACGLENLQFLTNDAKPLNAKFSVSGFDNFAPIFSLKRRPNESERSYQNGLVKYEVARIVFARIMAEVLSFFTTVDQHDELLLQIDKLHSEQLAIVEEANIEQNEIVQQSVYLDKLSLIVEPIIGQYLDAERDEFLDYLRQYANFTETIETLNKKISNFMRICPGLDSFALKYFKTQKNFRDMRVAVPSFCFEEEFETFIGALHSEQLPGDAEICERYAAYCGAFFVHFSTLQPYFAGVSISDISQYAESVTKRISKMKGTLLRFLIKPESFHFFAVREEISSGRQLRPIEDVYAENHSSIRSVIENLAIYLILCPENSEFLKICENYNNMRTFEPAGVAETVGGTYHYDCMLKDTEVADALHYTVRKLSVIAFRYFIIEYCALIFISSLVFKQYKSHGEPCFILSSFATLGQDRFIYLICQISNSLNIICNVKGFTEIGAVGYVNVIFDRFMRRVEADEPKMQLEQLIMEHDFDDGIAELCSRFENAEVTSSKDRTDVQDMLDTDCNPDSAEKSFEENATINVAFPQDVKLDNQATADNFQSIISQMRLAQVKSNKLAGEQIVYKARQPERRNDLLEYANLGPEQSLFVDFLRGSARVFHRLTLLCYLALELHEQLVDEFNREINKFDAFEIFPLEQNGTAQQNLSRKLFLQFYTEIAGSLLIRNECQADVFPSLTENAALAQLVGFENDSGTTCVLDEICKLFCWASSQFGGASEALTLESVAGVIERVGIGFENSISLSVEPHTTMSLFKSIPAFEFQDRPITPLVISVESGSSYQEITKANEHIIKYIPELASNQERFEAIERTDESTNFAQLSEYCEVTLKELLEGQKIDLNASMRQYYDEIYCTDFNIDDNIKISDVLLIAALRRQVNSEM